MLNINIDHFLESLSLYICFLPFTLTTCWMENAALNVRKNYSQLYLSELFGYTIILHRDCICFQLRERDGKDYLASNKTFLPQLLGNCFVTWCHTEGCCVSWLAKGNSEDASILENTKEAFEESGMYD